MIFKIILTILILTSTTIKPSSIEIKSDESSSSSTSINCDSFFMEAEDEFLFEFLIRHDLKNDYISRNENYEKCLKFLSKFILKIEQYKHEQGHQYDYKPSKRA
jgi:hypothetical protein